MSETPTVEPRQYRILSLLGKGGFGTVYRARLEGSQGFVKEVAIKLLSDQRPPTEVLSRFRDEARILGLVRDRNVVAVDPPTRLGGRWAVVMDYVDGTSCEEALRQGPLPVTVALEIVEEVARTLDNLFHHQGPDGKEVRLLHRDLKPANLQLTPNGEVKVLDFGIARAAFANRETTTTTHIGGTFGYIAPERLEGHEGPEADIYSLGVVLHELLVAKRPGKPGKIRPEDLPEGSDPGLAPFLDLACRMRSTEAEDRPDARSVERLCRELRGTAVGPTLRDWARENVPPTPLRGGDPLVGSVLTETLAGIPRMPDRLPDEGGSSWGLLLGLGAAVVTGVVALLLVAGLVTSAGVASYLASGSADVAPPPSLPPVEASLPDAPAPDLPAPPPDPEPSAAAPAPAPAPEEVAVAPAKPVPAPSSAPKRPAPATAPPVAPPALAEAGVVQVTGDAHQVRLLGAGGTFEAGTVPAGAYTIQADFGRGLVSAGSLRVAAGQRLTVRCVAGFQRCTGG